MDDFANTMVLDGEAAASPTGGGQMALSDPAPKESVRDSIAAAAADMDKPAEKPVEQPKEEVKDEGKEEKPEEAKEVKQHAKPEAKDAKPAKEEAPADTSEKKPEAQEEPARKTYPNPPKGFMPDAVEKWKNVPHAVARDIETMVKTHEETVAKHQEYTQRYERLRDFDELAKSNGRDLRDSLTRVKQFEDMMRQNPIAALNMALQEAGPRKADGQALSLYEIAQAIVQNGPETYQQLAAQRPQEQPREDPRVVELQERLRQVEMSNLEANVIAPFKADHPRYDELQDDIAFWLQSGRIPDSYSLQDRLALAYDMAARINPASNVQPSASEDRQEEPRAAQNFGGDRSIKSSPGAVSDDVEDRAARGESILESIQKEARRLRRG